MAGVLLGGSREYMDAQVLIKRIDKYDKLADKNYMYYQESGEPRYDKAYEKYSELADVYRLALKEQQDHDDALSRRFENFSYYVKEHVENMAKDTYTKKEVLELAERMKQFVF